MSSNNVEKTVSAEQHSLSDKQQSTHESETASKELHLVTSEDSVEFEKSRGVRRIENVRTMMLTAKNGKLIMVTFIVCLLIIAWVYSLDSSTTSSYAVPATSSFNRHSMISSVNIASLIIGSVVQPFQAKFSDITSRPLCFAVSLGFYTMGVIVAAASSTIGAYVVGSVCTAVGSNGVSFVRDIIVADLTDLKWRGVANALMTSPYIITVWFSGLIVEAILNHNWRWGYGMFAIIMPVVVLPAILVLYHFEHKAQKLIPKEERPKKTFLQVVWESAIQMDAFGLILMGFGWALLLLPFSLQPYAKDGWGNPSLIAMLVVGPVLLVVFAIYEFFFAPFPLMPRRILYNKTFVSSVLINFIYLLADGVRSQYLTSILLVGKNWSYQNWTYFGNTLTVSLCFFGLVSGATYRIVQRYKWLNTMGIIIRMIAYILPIRSKGTMANTASFVMCQILVGVGSAYNTVGTIIASQASVPHQDMSSVMALLLLWSTVGSAIGYTISGSIWTSRMYIYLREYIPQTVADDEVYNYYTDLTTLFDLEWDSPTRQGAVKALANICPYFFVAPVILEFINVLISFTLTDYYLGDTHNAIEDQNGRDPTNHGREKREIPTTWKGKFLYLLS
uniref:Major facilitator superfamily (MFS) profile domain-containing protein n=1 Tax=Candidozyma auris TaxID=498019 RepID=A0A0L0P9I0_CANAR